MQLYPFPTMSANLHAVSSSAARNETLFFDFSAHAALACNTLELPKAVLYCISPDLSTFQTRLLPALPVRHPCRYCRHVSGRSSFRSTGIQLQIFRPQAHRGTNPQPMHDLARGATRTRSGTLYVQCTHATDIILKSALALTSSHQLTTPCLLSRCHARRGILCHS